MPSMMKREVRNSLASLSEICRVIVFESVYKCNQREITKAIRFKNPT